ncbi:MULTISPECIES: hypothetical protein [Photobacterium]|uniref:hypothetical protein n=1 Tax=Photobacterium TaxID=657 RepID=UPI0011B21481|nr:MULTISPECIES: hypothetical protein [Photobacterium]MBV1839105.1 hypothetical protein [Photobacterium ganghwense]QSV12825.1 hypothetical protein FH974_08515 [Photobacterium ganghwense]
MSESAKDINAIYASYKVNNHQYIEITEKEAYLRARRKWLVLQSNEDIASTHTDQKGHSFAGTEQQDTV